MKKTDYEFSLEDSENLQLFQRERLIIAITELMYDAMAKTKTRRVDIAKSLDLTRGRISQILSGDENLTLCTVADVFTVMGKNLVIRLENIHSEPECKRWYSSEDFHTLQPKKGPELAFVNAIVNCKSSSNDNFVAG